MRLCKQLVLASSMLIFGLTGCAISNSSGGTIQTVSSTGVPVQRKLAGSVHGGQQPVSGASIALYAVNTTSLRGASTSLLSQPVLTDRQGNFNIPDPNICPAGDYVYIVASGGDPGAGTNAASVLMAGLGSCTGVAANSFVNINEVTTVATAYALAPFMLDVQHVGGVGTTGIGNAFQVLATLVDTSTGLSPGSAVGANISVPSAEIYTLANILAECVNSNGATNACSALMAAAANPVRGTPADTSAAALAIAAAPANSVATLFTTITPKAPFQPQLISAPADWSIALTLSGSGLSGPQSVAIDSAGNGWVTNASGTSVTKFSPSGVALSGAGGFSGGGLFGPGGIAIDSAGNAWIANSGADSVVELSPSGAVLSNSGFSGGGINGPVAIAIDKQSNVWVTNFAGNSVTELSATGVASASSPLALGGLVNGPTGIAVGPGGMIWAASSGTGSLVAFNSSGTVQTGAGLTDGWLQGTGGLAIDDSGTAWAASPGNSALTAIGSNFSPLAISPDYNGALNLPAGVAIDGAGSIWVANSGVPGSISQLAATTGAGIAGSTDIGTLNAPLGIAVDSSGNVWTANSGSDSVSIFVGMATPAIVPLVARLP